jgi:hypothetical protein
MWILICGSLLAIGIASIAAGATGGFVRLGKRNAAGRTTAIVGSTTG